MSRYKVRCITPRRVREVLKDMALAGCQLIGYGFEPLDLGCARDLEYNLPTRDVFVLHFKAVRP